MTKYLSTILLLFFILPLKAQQAYPKTWIKYSPDSSFKATISGDYYEGFVGPQILSLFHNDSYSNVLSVMALLIPLLTVYQIMIGVYRAHFRIKLAVVIEKIFQPSSRLIVIIVFFFVFNVSLWAVIWGTLISFFLSLGCLIFFSSTIGFS